jgi:hypothetical protein
MRTLSLGKNSAIAATIGLSMLAAGVVQPAAAADFKASGRFADAVNFGNNPELLNLQGGSFDGTYSIDGVSLTPASSTVTSFLFNLRNSSGIVVKRFSDAIGDGAGFSFSPEKVSLGLGNGEGYLALDFAPDFSGTGPIKVNLPLETGMSSKTVSEDKYSDVGVLVFGRTELDVVSGSIESVPTPALLPGLIGIGISAFRKRRGEVEPAAD